MKRARDDAPATGDARSLSAARRRNNALYGKVKQARRRHAHTGVTRLGVQLAPLQGVDAARLLPGQRRAVDAVLSGRSVFLTGCGGTGKSFVIRTLQRHLVEECKVEAHVVATTGIAAVALKGVTVHSFFALGMGDKPVEEYVKRANMFHKLRHKLQGLHVLIIDEVSMLTEHVLTVMDAMLRSARRVEEPMGGVVVVACGDFLQLPVVHRGYADPPPPVCTSAVWASVGFDVHVLLQSMRHVDDAPWEAMLGRLRKGRVTAEDLEALEGRCVHDTEVPRDATWLLPTRAGVQHMNDRAVKHLQRPVVHLTPVLSALFTVTCLGSRPEWVDWGRLRDALPRHMATSMLQADVPGHTQRRPLPAGVTSLFPDDMPPAPQNAALDALRNTLQGFSGVQLCVGARVLLTCKLADVPPTLGLVNGSQGTVVGWARYTPPHGAYVHEDTLDEDAAQRKAAAAGRPHPTQADRANIVIKSADDVRTSVASLVYTGERALALPRVDATARAAARTAAQFSRVVTTPLASAHAHLSAQDVAFAERHEGAMQALPPVQGAVLHAVQNEETQRVADEVVAPCVAPHTPLTLPRDVRDALTAPSGEPDGAPLEAQHAACAATSVWVPVVRFDNGHTLPVAPQFFGVDVALPETSDTVSHHVRLGAWCCPLLVAAAITVHKAQGMSMDNVAIALANMHTTGQAYVALSRARSLQGVHVSHIDPTAIKADAGMVDMYDVWEAAASMLADDDASKSDGSTAGAAAASGGGSGGDDGGGDGGGDDGGGDGASPSACADISSFAYQGGNV